MLTWSYDTAPDTEASLIRPLRWCSSSWSKISTTRSMLAADRWTTMADPASWVIGP